MVQTDPGSLSAARLARIRGGRQPAVAAPALGGRPTTAGPARRRVYQSWPRLVALLVLVFVLALAGSRHWAALPRSGIAAWAR
jgi:hypothetical protein